MKIIFFGTPDFAVPALNKIHEKHEIVGVVTQPDKPRGRGLHVVGSEVEMRAKFLGIKNIFQPHNLNEQKFLDNIKQLNPDIGVVVSYGRILPESVLEIPKYSLINIHSSLLPKYRGASPINSAIKNGDKQTGITIMKIVKELDAGDILLQKIEPIHDDDNYQTLSKRLAELGAELILETLEQYEKNENCNSIVQDEKQITYTSKIKKQDCLINWETSCEEIYNFVRSICPNPCAYTLYKKKVLKIYKIEKIDFLAEQAQAGEIVEKIKNKGFIVKAKDGCLLVTEVKPENKKQMSANAFLCGSGNDCLGVVLGK
jgi:methionyl-tRNA formyltransferase